MLARIKQTIKTRMPRVAATYRICQSYWTGLRWIGKGMNAFKEIHDRNVWNDCESKSGVGSSLRATETIRAELPGLLERRDVKSILDVPCGDFYWMARTDLGGRSYTGVEIVPRLIEELSRTYGDNNRRFVCLDLSKEELPYADLILCRDCLVHFSFSAIKRALANFRQSNATYLLTTTYPHHPFNVDCPTGHWRSLNLQLAPFFFPAPLELIWDDVITDKGPGDKSLGLWRFDSLPLSSGRMAGVKEISR
jgi:SAM-dependent methyltransferase